MALVMREAELNRREASLRRAEEARAEEEEGSLARASSAALEAEHMARLREVERRERELEQMVRAVEAQRDRLEAVRIEYETRREALTQRTHEVEAERNRLRDEQAQLVCASLELEEREPAVAFVVTQPPAPAELQAIEPAAPVLVEPEQDAPAPPVAARTVAHAMEAPDDTDWWSKQLGSPLEAA